MDYFNKSGEFLFGKKDFDKSVSAAEYCRFFEHDNDEEEEISDIERSCYNCLYRKWTAESFICVKTRTNL